MKNSLTKNGLIAGICLFIPAAYADPDFSGLSSIEQIEQDYPGIVASSTEMHRPNRRDEVLVMQQGDNNEAVVGVNGRRNQLSLTQDGNNNNGEIQLNGDSNRLSALQNGDGLSFGLKIEGDSRAYTLTQERR